VQQAPRFRAPNGLANRVRLAVAQPAARSAAPIKAKPRWTPIAPWLAAAATILLGAALTFWILNLRQRTAEVDLVAHDVVSSHIRSLMAAHLTDVPSSDRHTVKPWFGGKVPYALTVPDFAAQGFVLDGGRLDYIGGRTVAALVYRRNQHVINVFVWPLAAGERAVQETRHDLGYEAIAWTASDQQYWAVSDVNDAELRAFVSLLQQESR
jgi:anti-sigma factor RsiW